MASFVERLRRAIEDRPDHMRSRITVDRRDLIDMLHHFKRLDDAARTKHKEEHPECHPPSTFTYVFAESVGGVMEQPFWTLGKLVKITASNYEEAKGKLKRTYWSHICIQADDPKVTITSLNKYCGDA